MNVNFISFIAADDLTPTYTLKDITEKDNPITLRWKLYNIYGIHRACISHLYYGVTLLEDDTSLTSAGVSDTPFSDLSSGTKTALGPL